MNFNIKKLISLVALAGIVSVNGINARGRSFANAESAKSTEEVKTPKTQELEAKTPKTQELSRFERVKQGAMRAKEIAKMPFSWMNEHRKTTAAIVATPILLAMAYKAGMYPESLWSLRWNNMSNSAQDAKAAIAEVVYENSPVRKQELAEALASQRVEILKLINGK